MQTAYCYTRTPKGTLESRNRASALPDELRAVLTAIDGELPNADLASRLDMPQRQLQRALAQLEEGGYIEPASNQREEADLDFTSPAALSRLQAEAEVRRRAETAAQSRAAEAAREAAAAQARERSAREARANADSAAEIAAQARTIAEAAARAADVARARAAADATSAGNAEARAEAKARMEAALLAETRAAAEARMRAQAESEARVAAAASGTLAEHAREEAHARARAESEAHARARAEAHARAMVEAQLKAMTTALARAETLAREEADARARLTADLEARETTEAQARASAASMAREEAEAAMRAELAALRAEVERARAEAQERAEAERSARLAAEDAAQRERAQREEAVRRARADAEAATRRESAELVEAQRRAHAAVRAADEARLVAEREARAEAEARAFAEQEARYAHAAAVAANNEQALRDRLAAELAEREEAERTADARYRADAAARARIAASARQSDEVTMRVRAVPPPRARSASLAKAAAVVAVAVTLGAAAAIPLVPLDDYVAPVERAMSAALGTPVHVARLRYDLWPAPRLTLVQVTLGATQESRVEEIAVKAWPWQLLGSPPSCDAIVVRDARLKRESLAAIAAVLTRGAGCAQRIDVENADIALQDGNVPITRATLRFDGRGAARHATVTSGTARVELTPVAAGWQFALDAREWKPPFAERLEFDALTVRGVLENGGIRSARLTGELARGTLTGTLQADWRGDVRAQGDFDLKDAQLERILPAYTAHFAAAGTVSARGRYALHAPSLSTLGQSAQLEGEFFASSGEIGNVDLVRAMQSTSRDGVRGGRTHFDRLAGQFEASRDRYRYRDLKLVSGPLAASGSVEFAPGHPLAGRITAEVQSKSRPPVRASLAVGGTLENPVLHP